MIRKITYTGNGQIRIVISPVESREARILVISKGQDIYPGDINQETFDGFAERPEFDADTVEEQDDGDQ